MEPLACQGAVRLREVGGAGVRDPERGIAVGGRSSKTKHMAPEPSLKLPRPCVYCLLPCVLGLAVFATKRGLAYTVQFSFFLRYGQRFNTCLLYRYSPVTEMAGRRNEQWHAGRPTRL